MSTIYDVAKESGFSLATVSNVLNDGPRPVKPETRQRILATMQRLNYHPSAMARGLARQRTHTIGVLFGVVEPSAVILNAYSAAVLQGILTAAASTGYNVTHYTAAWIDAQHSLPGFRDRRSDGLIVVAPTTDSDLMPSLTGLHVPLVAVSWPSERGDIPSVDGDDRIGSRLAVQYLVELGHRRIAHLMGHPNLVSSVARRDTFLDVLREAGITPLPEYILPGQYSTEIGHENARRLLGSPNPPTAIFAGNDEIAVGVVEAARELGIRIPDQLSLVGYDDRPLSALMNPRLTTIRQPFVKIGEHAVRLLIQKVEGKEVLPITHLLAPELVIRESTAPPEA
ncbi:MAG: LacI family DNA-binding transcriptional regulator [Fibrella sp.]|nr:LacI family DNA-binding transcriptional regulator [Armatimonadota bacterium]